MHRFIRTATILAAGSLALVALPGAAAKGKGKRAADSDPQASPSGNYGMDAETKATQKQLQGLFKSWDHDKDGSVSAGELDRFYRKLKAQSKKLKAKGNNTEDPMAPVTALQTKIDTNKDGALSRGEFDTWAASFAAYLSKYQQVQQRLAIDSQNMANVATNMQRRRRAYGPGGGYNNLANRFNSQLMSGLQRDIKTLNEELANLDPKGEHRPYCDFLFETYFAKFMDE